MTRFELHLCLAAIALPLTGCALTIGSDAVTESEKDSSTLRLDGTGIGATDGEARRDAWHDAAFRLRAMGYTSFHLREEGQSSSATQTVDGQPRTEVTMTYRVSDARRGEKSCDCDISHPCRNPDHDHHQGPSHGH